LSTFHIIVASRSGSDAERLSGCLARNPNFHVEMRVISNGHTDPLYGVPVMPDLLLLHCGSGQSELQFLAEQGTRENLPLLVCGPENDPEVMRLGMRAGARDYLPENVSEADLVASLSRIQEEILRSGAAKSGKLIVVVNGKGGSGASFLATNLSHSLVVDGGHRVTLADLDFQFGGLHRYLDLTPKVGILEALDAAHDMDEASANSYTCEHSSGVRLLAVSAQHLALPSEIPVEKLDALLDVFLSYNDYVVADSPNRLDGLTEFFLERADRIILVVQQSLPHVHDAARMLQLLTSEMAIPEKRIGVIVNRFAKNAPVELADIKKALRQGKLITVPNQYQLASESINSGIPVAEISKSAALTKGIRSLQAELTNPAGKPSPNFLKRALPTFFKERTS
jgi:pilus assembly protein CpaE